MKNMTMRTLCRCGLLVSTVAAAMAQSKGYLAPADLPDMIRILPAAPVADEARYAADRAIFKATRFLEGSPRWSLAQADDKLSPAALLKDFSCASGMTLSAETTPRTSALLTKALGDANAAVGPPKDFFKRQRPFLIDDGPTCISKSSLTNSPDYPSGHTTYGWTAGLILAELMPEHASSILIRARSFGESRVVCGVHNSSAIEAGRITGASVVAALHSSAAFRADVEAARAEIASLHPPLKEKPEVCSAEAGLTSKSPY